MDPAIPKWNLPLGQRPKIAAIGWGVHGKEKREESYYLKRLWCVHLYTYPAEIRVKGALLSIRPGDLSVLPPDEKLVYSYRGISRHLYAHFELGQKTGPVQAVRAVQHLGADWAAACNSMEVALGHFATEPLRSEIRLWDLLWEWAERSRSAEDPMHPALRSLVGRIETRLGEELKVAALIRDCGLSHNHMIRLFQKNFGTTIEGYIRSRRLSRAGHLLKNSTLPIKLIAGEVGIRDPQQFNKLIRRAFGKGPRKLRFES